MLTYHRTFHHAPLDVTYEVVELAQPGFKVRIERGKNVALDDAITYPSVGWSGYGDRPRLDVVLKGRARDRENGVARTLPAGAFAIGRALDTLYQRAEGPEFVVLAVEWNLGTLGTTASIGLPDGVLDRVALSSLVSVADDLFALGTLDASERSARSVHAVVRLLSCLRDAGLPFDAWRARDLAIEVPGVLQRVADAIGAALSRMQTAPAFGDIERALGVSRRRVQELVAEMSSRYGLNGSDWRTMRDRWRLTSAVATMSHPSARTEDVARALGYGSPNALCHAFRVVGLPSPGNIRAALAQLA